MSDRGEHVALVSLTRSIREAAIASGAPYLPLRVYVSIARELTAQGYGQVAA
jgi:hypothetical protein